MDSESAEEEKSNELEARIKAPLVWGRLDSIRIEDLQERRFDEALSLIREFYFDSEVLPYKHLKFVEDEESVNSILNTIRQQMKDKTSLVAVDENNGNLLAVLVIRVINKNLFSRTFDRIKIFQGDLYTKVFSFFNFVESAIDIHKLFECKSYFKLYHFALHPAHFTKDLYKTALKAIVSSASSLNINIVSGIFTSIKTQELAQSIGFEILKQIPYKGHIIKGKCVFEDESLQEESVAFMMFRNETFSHTSCESSAR